MRTHLIGAPGSLARFLDDHAHDPNAKPFPAPWCVFTYKATGGVLLCGAGGTKEAADCVCGAAEREHGWAVTVDVRTYGCRAVSERDAAKGDGSSSSAGASK